MQQPPDKLIAQLRTLVLYLQQAQATYKMIGLDVDQFIANQQQRIRQLEWEQSMKTKEQKPDAYQRLQALKANLYGDEPWREMASILEQFMEEQGLHDEALLEQIKKGPAKQ